jgi:hypothetical protein
LVYFALIMVAVLVLASLSLKWLFGYFARSGNPGSFVAAPFAGTRPLPLPPRIQPDPGVDLQNYYQSQQGLLNSFGWVDRQNGIVRLPIDRAMKLLLERGLPANPENTAPPQNRSAASAGASQSGESVR